ncbi:MAG: DNA/RNA helicase domain-containing protein [Flavobacteriales bacterium]
MIVYQSVKADFQENVLSGEIEKIILERFRQKLNKSTSPKEIEAWRNSLLYMDKVLSDPDIPGNVGVTIECQIPQTSKRIDFIISGHDELNEPQIVIIELKQWASAELTDKDGIVRTALGGNKRETNHPSYQAWSYATLLRDFSETIYSENISLWPCAFLHNYEEDLVIRNPFYNEYLEKAPVFLKKDMARLREFIRKYVRTGDNGEVMYRVDQGRIKPSKQLADSLTGLLRGNKEFILVDEQKLVYETALNLAMRARDEGKKVLIVEGGPGTGKSVVAINLLVELTNRERLVQYVTKNAAPRAVYQSKLTGTLKKTRFEALFQGSSKFHNATPNSFDVLIVDEAHRLNEKGGMFYNLGENQVMEIIRTAACSIFFIDEDQRVTLKDIGSKEEIRKWAKVAHAECVEMELGSQFRCNGSDGYLAWIDNMLQIRDTANTDLSDVDYDFRVFDSPAELRDAIFEKNQINNRARLVAGYCWEWISKNDTRKQDIAFPQFGFAMPWNFAEGSYLWSIKPDSVKEIGCIHTCQGLEMDYEGVIIGEDMIFRDGQVLVDPSKRARSDSSIKGYKTMLKKDPDRARSEIRALIKNTYRTLMTRGAKGCYVWCVDQELNEWVRGCVRR